jgi:mono/diheme cytochrome c family protein
MHFTKRVAVALGLVSLLGSIAGPLRADQTTEGKAIFTQYCASCHGPTGSGNGPLAAVLSTPPANLRLLSQRFGNPLPQDVLARFIDGRAEVKAHGPRDMPVWGERFYAESNGDEAEIKERIAKLVAFLQSIQAATRTASLKLEGRSSRGPSS